MDWKLNVFVHRSSCQGNIQQKKYIIKRQATIQGRVRDKILECIKEMFVDHLGFLKTAF